MPQRIQYQRKAGWRTYGIYVGRGRGQYGQWGNPNRIVRVDNGWVVTHDRSGSSVGTFPTKTEAARFAVAAYRHEVTSDPEFLARVRKRLAGYDLVCWCRLDQPCHADVLLVLANGGEV